MNPEEQKAAVDKIVDAMKARDAENATILLKVQEDVKSFGKVAEGTKDAIAASNTLGQELQGRLHDLEQKLATSQIQAPGKAKSVGEQFTSHPDFAPIAKRMASSAQGVRDRGFQMTLKTITSIGASAGDGIIADVMPGVVENPLRPLSIRDLLDKATTNSNSIEWVTELVNTNNAAMVSEGALKPQSDITYDLKTVPVRTIAHWIRASKQVLADFPLLQSMINGRLRWGLKIKEEDQILYGDGTSQNLLGLIPQATAYNTALNHANDTMIDVIRHAILQVRLAFYPASGVVLSPTDWHNLELTKDNENRYLMASPTSRTPPMIWGLPVVESDGMHAGNFLVGAFRLAATVIDREEASILVSTEDQDNFVRNLVTILCEERLALAVTRAQAFVYGGFPAGSTT